MLTDGTDPQYVPTGHIVFARANSLWAIPFDLEQLRVTAEPTPLLEDVQVNNGGLAQFAVAEDGALVYAPSGQGTWCFRHQVLLRCDRHVHDSGSGRPTQVSERQYVAQPPDNAPHGHEDVPKGQPPRGESRLHRRRPRLAAEPQRPMRPYEVVVATQQLEMRVERVGRACMGQRPS